MTWRILFTEQARKDMQSLDAVVAQRVTRVIQRLAETGHGNIKHLHGEGSVNRLRIGDWRVLFVRDASSQTIRITRVHHRSDAY